MNGLQSSGSGDYTTRWGRCEAPSAGGVPAPGSGRADPRAAHAAHLHRATLREYEPDIGERLKFLGGEGASLPPVG